VFSDFIKDGDAFFHGGELFLSDLIKTNLIHFSYTFEHLHRPTFKMLTGSSCVNRG
jgi:hypothetical protein